MKRKVLFLIDTLEVGGAERSLLEIVKRFDRTEPVVCSIYRGDALRPDFEQQGIRVITLNLDGKYNYIQAVRRVLAELRKESPNLIHTTLARSNFIGRTAGRLAKIPVVSTLVSESYSDARVQQLSASRRLKLKITRLLDSITAKFASHFVANSQTVKTHGCKHLGINSQNITVIYRGRDPMLYEREIDRSDIRGSVDVPPGMSVLLSVGRLVASKMQRNLILAMPEIIRQHQVRLFIAGEGPERPALTNLINTLKLNEVAYLLGNRNDVPDLLVLADIFLFPSSYEGFPGALLEAMFAGCAIIASDIPVHREMIEHQRTGLLCEAAPAQIAESARWLLDHPDESRAMGQRAKESAVEKFSIRSVVSQHEDLYDKLLQRRAASSIVKERT